MIRRDLSHVCTALCIFGCALGLGVSARGGAISRTARAANTSIPTTGPSAVAATQQNAATLPAQNSFPKEYGVLLTRSIFAHGKGPMVAGPTTGPATPTSPEQGFVLRGVALQGPDCTALLEELAGGKTRQLHVGDEIFGGRVVGITMNGVDRTLGGRMVHIVVGQALDGSVAAPPQAGAQPQLASDVAPPNMPAGQPMPQMNVPGAPMPAGAKILRSKD
jgi:hypothetical protein